VPLYKARSEIHGYGAFASRPIKKGETIAVWDGPYADKLPNDESAKYYLYVRPNKWLVGFGCDYAESFINHSSAPNSKIIWHDDVATLIALRSVESNEEVTFDYATVCPNWETPPEGPK
jgi:SET domain-containing protein